VCSLLIIAVFLTISSASATTWNYFYPEYENAYYGYWGDGNSEPTVSISMSTDGSGSMLLDALGNFDWGASAMIKGVPTQHVWLNTGTAGFGADITIDGTLSTYSVVLVAESTLDVNIWVYWFDYYGGGQWENVTVLPVAHWGAGGYGWSDQYTFNNDHYFVGDMLDITNAGFYSFGVEFVGKILAQQGGASVSLDFSVDDAVIAM
jgi:hypothetical protein